MGVCIQAQRVLDQMNFISSKPTEAIFNITLKGQTALRIMPKKILSRLSITTVLMELLP